MNPRPRALVVEDDRSWQQILAEILSDCGLEVDTAGNLAEALASLKLQPHRLVVVDLSLAADDHSNEDGLRVLDAARRLDPGCRTILLTGFATVELAVSALTEYNAFTFLRKESFQRARFRETVSRLLACAPPISPAEEIPAPQPQPAAGQAGGGKALLVEDDAGWRSILSELLVDAGFQVRSCASFGEALGSLRREKFSLAVVDLSLTGTAFPPGEELEGCQLLASARLINLPAIVVSGMASPEEIRRVYAEQSIFAYIEKQTFDRASFRRLAEAARRARHPTGELAALTGREGEVLELLAQGLTNKEIAERLIITTNTVKRHIKAIFEKLDVHTRSAAAARAARE